jgi:hypothetical protein
MTGFDPHRRRQSLKVVGLFMFGPVDHTFWVAIGIETSCRRILDTHLIQ